MEARYRFDTFSSEEIREIAQALRENGGAGGAHAISEFELQEIINALQEANRTEPMDRTNSIERDTGNPTVNIAVTGESGSETNIDSSEFFEIISDEELEEIKDALEKGDLCTASEKLTETLKEIENAPLNIAITGESGSGKSTFINAIRSMDNDEEDGAAKTGVVETTKVPKAYPHPQFNNVTFWDLPGIGSPDFKPDIYLKAVEFSRYDFFVIISSARFRNNDMKLAKEIDNMGKKFYFVRSKVDSDLYASQIRRKKSYNEENILREIRDDCLIRLRDGGIRDPQVFLLSCIELEKYDFSQMQETLERELPSHKKLAFMMCLPNISLPVLEKKRQALKKNIKYWAGLSCAVATVPLPGLSVACDIGILIAEMKKYRKAFGLDHSSLQRLASKCGKDIRELKSVIKSPIVIKEINKELVITLLSRVGVGGLMFAEYLVSNIPVFGPMVAGGISFGTTYWMLSGFLKDITEDAVRVLKKALDSPV